MSRNRGSTESMAGIRRKNKLPSSSSMSDKQAGFLNIVSSYLDGMLDRTDGIPELEIRFGTRDVVQPTTKQNFDNVIQKLLASGYVFSKKNAYSLKIQNEFVDPKTGQTKLSLIRAEIHGINDVQKYCKTNQPDDKYVLFTQKMYARQPAKSRESSSNVENQEREESATIMPVIFDDFNFKVSYQREKRIANTSTLARSILKTWNDNKKTFRYINRTTMIHPDFPFQIDLSVVKESHRDRSRYIPETTFEAAKVLDCLPRYEIEIEVINDQVGPGTSFNHPKYLLDKLRKTITTVLSGIQETNYPVSYIEMQRIQRKYHELLHPEEHEGRTSSTNKRVRGLGEDGGSGSESDSRSDGGESDVESDGGAGDSTRKIQLRPKHFIGPSSFTLQMQNIMPINPDSKSPNIRLGYSVTEKADGMRKLLFIAPKTGRIYLIDTNMNIQFTGAVSLNTKLYNTLIDGEHILHNKNGDFINLFLAFDIYYVHKADVRARLFFPANDDEVLTNFRLPLLISVVKNLQTKCVSGGADSLPPIRIEHKIFEIATSQRSIFDCCATIMRKIEHEQQYEYWCDGLIFTPLQYGVGSNVRNDGNAGPLYKTTWNHSFKWKPTRHNTIDFLVTTKKDKTQEEIVSNLFKQGVDMSKCVQVQQYKTLILRVGYDEKKHGYINPCNEVIEGKNRGVDGDGTVGGSGGTDGYGDDTSGDNYKPAPFYPTYPYDNDAHICNIMLRPDEAGVYQMMTTENDIIMDETIVEFSYDETKPVNWRWSPLRVRHDKTAEYRAGGKNYGNAYHVANSNWHSIHNAITDEMIMTGEGIPDELSNEDVYYNQSSHGDGIDIGGGTKIKSLTKGMRDFHNLYVKRKLILGVAKPGNTLIDFAVGKGGDLPKWIAAKLGFVFGIDYSKDNLEHKFDGVCARYLESKKNKRNIPPAIFIHGDSSKEIKTGQAAISERYRIILRSIFGEGPKDASILGRGVYPHYGRGVDGFDICSVQFAIHYFFEDIKKVHTFLQNVSECTKLGGYFIGTCFDGARIFQALASVENGEEVSVFDSIDKAKNGGEEHKKIWSLRKKYNQTEFEPDSSSIGYEIEVFQESINKSTKEYLVNFDYLTQLLENYGFDLVTPEEAATTLNNPMPDGTGTFDSMFHQMELDIKRARETSGAFGNSRYDEYGASLMMRPEEKRISFYNRYFIFRKNRNINAKQLKNSFLSYAGLQEEHAQGAEAGSSVLDEETEKRAIEKITRASLPIDVATKPAIAANILKKMEQDKLQKQLDEGLIGSLTSATTAEEAEMAAVVAAATASSKKSAKTRKTKLSEEQATYDKQMKEYNLVMKNLGIGNELSAPIEQIERAIKKRTRKTGVELNIDIKSAAEVKAGDLPEKHGEEENPGIANPIQPPKTLKVVRRVAKKPASGAGAVASASNKGSDSGKENPETKPKKTRKKKE
jgi:hypothetical protein